MSKHRYLFIMLVFFFSTACSVGTKEDEADVEGIEEEADLNTEQIFGFNRVDFEVEQGKIKPNENLSSILSAVDVSLQSIDSLAKISSANASFDVKHLMFNKNYFVLKDKLDQKPKYFVYQPNDEDYVVFKLESPLDVYAARKETKLVERTLTGVITKNSSIYEVMIAAGATPKLVNELVDIFAWQINFFSKV